MALPRRISKADIVSKRSGAVNPLDTRMSRGQALRMMGVMAGVIGGTAVGMGGVARAIGGDEPWDNKLYPTGIAQRDSLAIQEAVNRGGVVRLMSAQGKHFNLVDCTITIARSVSIIGQGTKIKYGNAPAFSCNRPRVRLSIQNINLMDIGQAGVCPFAITKPARTGSVQIDFSKVAIGGDEPWD